MSWQLLLIGYLVLGTAAYLIRRKLAQVIPEHNRFVNWFFFLGVLYPVGLVVAFFSHPNLHIGLANLVILLVGELVFPVINLLSYRANEDVDAGLYTIINNLTPIITISSAWLLLNETLSNQQLLGATIIITSTFLVSLPSLLRRSRSKAIGLAFALASVSLLGLAITFERYMLTRIDFGAYLVYGWGAQTLWMTILAWPERKNLGLLKNQKVAKFIIGYGFSNTFKGLCFVGALKLSGNASLVSAFSSFMSVLVVLGAYFALKEKEWLLFKIIAAMLGALGLLILNTG